MPTNRYLIALGSNQRHFRLGRPRQVLRTALNGLAEIDVAVTARSTIIASRPVGPSDRQYANAVAIIETELSPSDLLRTFKYLENRFGSRRGQIWSRRVLDLDIILWSEGVFVGTDPALTIPHPLMRERTFVLAPATQIAASWRDPISGLTIRQLYSRQKRGKPLDPVPKRH